MPERRKVARGWTLYLSNEKGTQDGATGQDWEMLDTYKYFDRRRF